MSCLLNNRSNICFFLLFSACRPLEFDEMKSLVLIRKFENKFRNFDKDKEYIAGQKMKFKYCNVDFKNYKSIFMFDSIQSVASLFFMIFGDHLKFKWVQLLFKLFSILCNQIISKISPESIKFNFCLVSHMAPWI